MRARTPCRNFLLVTVLLLAASLQTLEARELWERKWRMIETPHFTVYSEMSESKTRKIVEDIGTGLKNIRGVVGAQKVKKRACTQSWRRCTLKGSATRRSPQAIVSYGQGLQHSRWAFQGATLRAVGHFPAFLRYSSLIYQG